MAILEEAMQKHAAVPDRSEPPDLQNAYDHHQLGYSAQPPAKKKPRTDCPPADTVGTAAAAAAAASSIIRNKKRSRRPTNRPDSAGDTPKPSRCLGILEALLREGVTRPTLILEKEMSASDVSGQQSRLLLTRSRVMATPLPDLITSDEAALVVDRHQGLPVRVFDRLGREYAMKFKFLTCNGDFRLIGSWGRFVKCNGLLVGDSVDLWAFRCRRGLGMALLSRKKGDEEVPKDNDDDDDFEDDDFEDDELVAAEALLLLQNPRD